MMTRLKPWVSLAVKVLVSFAILAVLFHKIDIGAVWRQAQQADGRWVALAVVVQVIQVPIGGARWAAVADAMALRLRFSRACELFYVSSFINVVVPGAVGGDGFRMWRLRADGIAVSEAVTSVLLERVASLFGLFCLVTATQPILLSRVGAIPGAWVFPLLVACGAIGIAALMQLDRLPARWRMRRLGRGLGQFAVAARAVFWRPGPALRVLAWAVAGHANLALVVWCLAQGLGLPIDLVSCLTLVPPVILLLTLPISIAGWGVREQAMVTAFGFIGIAAPSALVLSLMFGVVGMVAALPGGVLWLAARSKSLS